MIGLTELAIIVGLGVATALGWKPLASKIYKDGRNFKEEIVDAQETVAVPAIRQ